MPITVTCSKSWPSSWDPATTSRSAIHCSRSSISRFSLYSLRTSPSFSRLSSARSFRLAYSLSTCDCFTAIASLQHKPRHPVLIIYQTTKTPLCHWEYLGKKRKSIYIVPCAHTWIMQFYLQIKPCLPFLHKRSPDGATPYRDSRHPIAAYYTFIDPKGMTG